MARKPADQSVSRDEILVAAAEVLQRNGYEAATMKDIAAAVNLTAASLYHHFRNKDTLMLAVLEAGLSHIMGRIEPIAHDTKVPSAIRLRRMIAEHIIGLTQNTAVGAAMVFEIRTLMTFRLPVGDALSIQEQEFAARRDAFFARRDEFELLFRHVIRQGIDSGEFRPVDVPIFTKTLLGAHNWVGVWYKPNGRLDGAGIAERTADYFLAALRQNEPQG